MGGVTRVDWGEFAVLLNVSSFYETEGNEHEVAALAELRVPSLTAWNQLKSTMKGKLCMEQDPSNVKVNVIQLTFFVDSTYESFLCSIYLCISLCAYFFYLSFVRHL